MMKLSNPIALLLGAALLGSAPAMAGDTIKIGFIGPYSGIYADLGGKMQEGVKLYVKLHGDRIAGKKIELLFRDDNNGSPEVAKRLTQELATRDNVDILSGYVSTPSAMASVSIATKAKKPMLIVQAATSGITEKSPYAARLSYTLGQVAAPLGSWAAKNGIKRVFTLVSDFGPGYSAQAVFTRTFTQAGGQIIGGVKVPLGSLEFGPFVQRARDAKPDAIFAFVPAGQTAIALMKSVAERELAKAGIRLITTGDVVSEGGLDAIGNSAVGVISAFHYSTAHDSPANNAFIKAFTDAYGTKSRPDFMAMQGYDTMATIYTIGNQLKGDLSGDKFMAALKNFKMTSPRGPIEIDADTREVVQNVYIRKVERRGDHLYNVEFATIEAARDPGK
ncbi:MAG TPA: ABC transporter substrate-binding protein [Stellaceae bacterium]